MMDRKAKRSKVSGKAWEKAYDEIKENILSMKIKPGESVSEMILSNQLGISRTPVREAIKKLEHEGLIVSENRRKKVYVLTIREINEIFDLKKAIEGSIARIAVERGSEKHRPEIESSLKKMTDFAEKDLNDSSQKHQLMDEWLEIDREFHAILFEMAENNKAEQFIDNLNFQWHRLKMGLLVMEGRLIRNIKEHQKLAEAVIHGDALKAEKIMTDHLEELRKTLTDIMTAFHFPM